MEFKKFAIVTTTANTAAAQRGRGPWEAAVARLRGEIVKADQADVIVIVGANVTAVRIARAVNENAKIVAVLYGRSQLPIYTAGATLVVNGPTTAAAEAESILRDLLRIPAD